MPPAARMTDIIFYNKQQTDPLIPVVNAGKIIGSSVTTVLIGGLPAAVVGDLCLRESADDKIATGSATVMINGKPAARMNDKTVDMGTIALGCPTVIIGD